MSVSIQDRTREFQQCVSTFSRQNPSKYTPDVPQRAVSRSEFSRNASIIAKQIAGVTQSLSKLAQLARRKQLFNDRPTDIIELTYVIKQDIFRIEKSLKNLQKQAGGGSSDAQVATYNKNVVQLLNTKTKNISETFKDVLQVRQRNELAQRSRQEQLLASVRPAENNTEPASAVPYALRSKKMGRETQSASSENPFLAPLLDGNADDPPVSDISTLEANRKSGELLSLPDQSQQLMLLEEQDSRYLQERNHAVESIESTINEVGGLFQQLATMVQEQGEQIQRIDNNVEDVSLNIGGAHRELLKYYNNISNNRWLMVKIFGILIVFFLLWVLVS